MPDSSLSRDAATAKSVARENAAQQYGVRSARGPHPLPLFWTLARQVVGDDQARMQGLVAAVARYQLAPRRPPRLSGKVIEVRGSVRLVALGGTGPPLVLVPSLVNPPDILDLDAKRSLARWLAAKGFAVRIVDWGTPGAEERRFTLGDYVTERLIPLLRNGDAPTLAGYCLGGTLAMAAAVHGAAHALVTIATPWNFAGYGERRREKISGYAETVLASAEALGAVPMSMIQPAFWALDPELPVRKFERYARMAAGSPQAQRFERMEDWANGGVPVALPAFREAARNLFTGDVTGAGEWRVGGKKVKPESISVPWLDFTASRDEITPAEAAPPARETRAVAAGHVGMIVGGRAREQLWQPLAQWLKSL